MTRRYNHFSQLTPALQELIACANEESGEIVQAASKILRHGRLSYDPTLPIAQRSTNLADFTKECGELIAVVEIMVERMQIDGRAVDHARREKHRNVWRWLHHNKARP